MIQDNFLQLIVAIVIAFCLLILTLRFAFNSNFRNDVIAGEGETKILGVLSAKGTLILVLLLGLVGSLIFLSLNFTPQKKALSKDDIKPDPSEWYVLNKYGNFIRPRITYSGSSLFLGINTDSIANTEIFIDNKLNLFKSEGNILIQKNASIWGRIEEDNLDSMFFNTFKLYEKEELQDKDFNYIKFIEKNGYWNPRSYSFFNAFTIKVENTTAKETIYLIKNNKTGKTVFTSSENSQVINAGENNEGKTNRIFHIYQQDNDYYLFRILFADIKTEEIDPYITFLGFHLRPELNLK